MYRCEVSAEAPEFKTGELEKEMRVFCKFPFFLAAYSLLALNERI